MSGANNKGKKTDSEINGTADAKMPATINNDNLEHIWEKVKSPTSEWLLLEKEEIDGAAPFTKDTIFDEAESALHEQAKFGQSLMGLKTNETGTPKMWLDLFEKAYNENEAMYDTEEGEKLQKMAIRLARTNPLTFDVGFWTDKKLRQNLVTNPWVAANEYFGSPWTSLQTYDEVIKERQEFDAMYRKMDDISYIDIPREEHTRPPAAFNMWARKHVTFVKYKSPLFEADSRAERVKEFTSFMTELLQTIWEADPRALLIPWEATCTARAIKKSTTKLPNSSDGWRLYTDRVFLKKDARTWPRMRIAHDIHPMAFEEKEFVEAFTNNDSMMSVESLQVYESSKIGWFLGSHVNAFNSETMIKALRKQPELKNIKIAMKNEFIKLEPGTQGSVRAVHIYAECDKAFECRQAMIAIYARDRMNRLPLGKNLRFIPDTLDARFVTTFKSLKKIKKCEAKQKVFMNTSSTAINYTIVGLDEYNPTVDMSLRKIIMGIRSMSQPERNLFLNVDKMAGKNHVLFAFHNDLADEARLVVSALPVLIMAKFPDNASIWRWFTDEARLISDGYHWDNRVGIVETVARLNLEFDGADSDSDDSVHDVNTRGNRVAFDIDVNTKGRTELYDDGSTVKSFKSLARKRKYSGSQSQTSSITSVVSDKDRFDHLMKNDPTYRQHVLNQIAGLPNGTTDAEGDIVMDTTRGGGADG